MIYLFPFESIKLLSTGLDLFISIVCCVQKGFLFRLEAISAVCKMGGAVSVFLCLLA